MIDYSYITIQNTTKVKVTKTITFTILLSRGAILDTLKEDEIYINGSIYEVPYYFLVELLANKQFGITEITLVEKVI